MAKERKVFLRAQRRRDRIEQKISENKKIPKLKQEHFTTLLTQALEQKPHKNTQVHLHVGPANSGKTYHAIESLKKFKTGVYLSPLRLLAWEIADKLNAQGHPCSLLTGEEKIIIPNAPFMASTVEMFHPDETVDCVVLDESQMLADEQRGWAWMRVLATCNAKQLEIIAAPNAEKLLHKILEKFGYPTQTTHHQRLCPLTVAPKPWRIDHPIENTIYVVFTRSSVLNLKTYFEKRGWSVAAIYGNLPPEVKKAQAERFTSGEAKLCVATDAIGMGINLPAERVCLTTLMKYDGQSQRLLTPAETLQIAGRAGRFGIKEFGEVGALTHDELKQVRELLSMPPPDLEFTRVSIELSDLQKMEGSMLHRLEIWEKHHAIPNELRDVILPADLEQQKRLASFLKEDVIQQMGLETALTLIKTPVGKESFNYWMRCVQNILQREPMPLPQAQKTAHSAQARDVLLQTENIVGECDIYLWLAHRLNDHFYGPEEETVLKYKWEMIEKIEHELSHSSRLQPICRKCGNKLPIVHAYSVCEPCFQLGRKRFFSKPKHKKFKLPRH